MLTIQSIRQASGKEILSWTKMIGFGLMGAALSSVVLFLFVSLF